MYHHSAVTDDKWWHLCKLIYSVNNCTQSCGGQSIFCIYRGFQDNRVTELQFTSFMGLMPIACQSLNFMNHILISKYQECLNQMFKASTARVLRDRSLCAGAWTDDLIQSLCHFLRDIIPFCMWGNGGPTPSVSASVLKSPPPLFLLGQVCV